MAAEAFHPQLRILRKTIQQVGDRRVVFDRKPMHNGKACWLHFESLCNTASISVFRVENRLSKLIRNDLMEVFKAIVADCLSPLIVCLMFQFIGWLAMWKQKKRFGLTLIAGGTVVLSVGGLSGLTYEARRTKEYRFTPANVTDIDSFEPSLIVVLGTGFNDDPKMPANSRVSGTFLSRILEGVRIYRSSPNARLLISVAGDASEQSKVEFLKEMIELLQLDLNRVSMISTAESTSDEAELTLHRMDDQKLFLVTSAGHMDRAMTIFADAGLAPIAAPAAYTFARAGSSGDKVWRRWLPSTDGVNGNHQWLYENAALLWHQIYGD